MENILYSLFGSAPVPIEPLSIEKLMKVVGSLPEPPPPMPTKVSCHPDRFDAATHVVDALAEEQREFYFGGTEIIVNEAVPKNRIVLMDREKVLGVIDLKESHNG